MHRYHYRAQLRSGIDPGSHFQEILPELQYQMKACSACRLRLFAEVRGLFLYYESPSDRVDPHSLFTGCEALLEQWPGEDTPRYWAPMMDIFHYQSSVDTAHWRSSNKAATPYARIARLKPEQVASYVFYHYQYQEEKPGDGDKYGIIALHENLLFFYSEKPATLEAPSYAGKLATSGTPRDWTAAMLPHFIPWNRDSEPLALWKEIMLVIQIDEP